MGCSNRHIDEETLEKASVLAWMNMMENIHYYSEKWLSEAERDNDDFLQQFRVSDFWELTECGMAIEYAEVDFIQRMMESLKIYEENLGSDFFGRGRN